MAAFGREIDLRNEPRLSDGLRPWLPTLGAARGGDGVVGRRGGVGGVGRVPDVPARGGDHRERLAVHPFEEQRRMHGHVRLQRRREIECAVADAGRRSRGGG